VDTVHRALASIDEEALVRDASEVVAIPSLTGDERHVLEHFCRMAERAGLETQLWREDPRPLLERDDSPGAEVERDDLWLLTATLRGRGARRLAVNGHVDVVPPGPLLWRHDPWSGTVEDGRLYGRGSLDMKGALVAAVHALAAIRRAGITPPGDVVLQAVPSEEDGGLGTFAALLRDDAFDACLIVEPTELEVVCAHAGALTFAGVVQGRSAHAAMRLEGCSAIERYVQIHTALNELEREMNRKVDHPLMSALELPYPLVVGRVSAGSWPSQVPDQLVFEGRVGVPIGVEPRQVRAQVERVVRLATADGEAPVELSWTGGQMAPAETPSDHPFAQSVRAAVSAERGEDAVFRGVPWGADMRLFTERGIPTLMCGPRGFHRAHAVDEWVAVTDLHLLARVIVRVALAS
jgi:acetylornithine deacetylase